MPALPPVDLMRLLTELFPALFLAILFLQSGFDKAFDWSGNLSYLREHFAKTPMRAFVPWLLLTMTVLEISTGIASVAGIGQLLLNGQTTWAFIGGSLAALSLSCLFLGQRLAKDYAGAAGLVPYFLLALATMVIERR